MISTIHSMAKPSNIWIICRNVWYVSSFHSHLQFCKTFSRITRTPSGRARAWLRLALMQKKLADYFRHLVDLEVLSEFYETRALLRSEEAAIVTGLLLSLNIVDCNLCVKVRQLLNSSHHNLKRLSLCCLALFRKRIWRVNRV